MTATGLDVIDKTVQTTNIWLNEIMDDLGPDRQFAWHVLGVVLRALRDRLPAELGANLGAELPLLIRGAYYDQYQPSCAEPGSHCRGIRPSHRGSAEIWSTRERRRGDKNSVQDACPSCRPWPVGESARRLAERRTGAMARQRRRIGAASKRSNGGGTSAPLTWLVDASW